MPIVILGATDRWVVLSGSSGGGKSTLLAELARRGHAVVAEPGRRIIAEQRACGGSALPWVDPVAFAERAVAMALADRREAVQTDGWLFFDRGLVDALVALEHATGQPHLHRAADHRYGSRVFFAPPWRDIFASEADRQHGWEEAVAECRRLERGFAALGYAAVLLPKADVGERADFVLAVLRDG